MKLECVNKMFISPSVWIPVDISVEWSNTETGGWVKTLLRSSFFIYLIYLNS